MFCSQNLDHSVSVFIHLRLFNVFATLNFSDAFLINIFVMLEKALLNIFKMLEFIRIFLNKLLFGQHRNIPNLKSNVLII